MSRESLKAELSAAVASARAIGVAVDDYNTLVAFEADVAACRTTLADLMERVDAEWGSDGLAVVTALGALAARLLDLRSSISDALATVTVRLERPTSLAIVAAESYGDWSRWVELAQLNPGLPNPAWIPAGTEIVRYVH